MQVLNVRSGEEGLVMRNAMVWADKIQTVSICKQIPSVPFGEIILAGGIWQYDDVVFQLFDLCQQVGVCVNLPAWP